VSRNRQHASARNYLEISSSVEAGGHRDFYFAMGEDIAEGFSGTDYDRELSKAVALGQAELAKVRIAPDFREQNMSPMFSSLVAQCLQMFSRANDGVVRPRQGGRSFGTWPTEAVEMHRALDRIGLGGWSKKGYEFFRKYQTTEGDQAGRFSSAGAPQWGGITGAVLFGLGSHLVQCDDRRYFESWREPIRAALQWIESQRAVTRETSGLGCGLLPPMLPHDWPLEGQFWCWTDGWTYAGVREIATALEHFGDPMAEPARAQALDYEKCLKETLARLYEPQKDNDTVFITNLLGREETYPPLGPYFCDGPVNLIRFGIIEAKSEIFEKVERYFVHQGWMKNGLTGLMTDNLIQAAAYMSDPWAGHTWYTSFSDLVWFKAWLERGERERAQQILSALLTYGMTAEFYMQERYADNDPDFCPWQPNASANGRTIIMLLDFFGHTVASSLASDAPH
jgi:hypothetical protein